MSIAKQHPGLNFPKRLSRRSFLKLSALAMGGSVVALGNRGRVKPQYALPVFPQSERLARVCVGKVDLKLKPDENANTVGTLFEDAVLPWVHETIGPWAFRNNQRWVETPQGYIWSTYVQPTRNILNQPLKVLPKAGEKAGMWVEVTVPWVDAVLANPPARSHWIKSRQEHGLPPRLYYSQILWIDDLKVNDAGQVLYRVNERYGNPGDIFWVPADVFRPITAEEITPISPDITDKRIVVNINWRTQTLSAFEGQSEVFFCRVSSGVSEGATPLTPRVSPGFPIWRKLTSLHMAGGTNTGGWDLIGIAWTQLFVGEGVALHSTYWHNNFGEPMSHGCINLRPEDAKWLFRWSQPVVPSEPGDLTITGDGSTRVIVKDE